MVGHVYVCTGKNQKGELEYRFIDPIDVKIGEKTVGEVIRELEDKIDKQNKKINKLGKAVVKLVRAFAEEE